LVHPGRLGILAALVVVLAMLLPGGAHAHSRHQHHRPQATSVQHVKPGTVEARVAPQAASAAVSVAAMLDDRCGGLAEPAPLSMASSVTGADEAACVQGCSHGGDHTCCVAMPWTAVIGRPTGREPVAVYSVKQVGIKPGTLPKPPKIVGS
jgi:hypothetical protein